MKMKTLVVDTNEAVVKVSKENRVRVKDAVLEFNDQMMQAGLKLRLEACVYEVFGLKKGAKKYSDFTEMGCVEVFKK